MRSSCWSKLPLWYSYMHCYLIRMQCVKLGKVVWIEPKIYNLCESWFEIGREATKYLWWEWTNVLTKWRMYGSKCIINRKVFVPYRGVRYRLVSIVVMKIGIANNDAITLTGSKSQPTDICIARLTGTWKAIDTHLKQLITGVVTIRFFRTEMC